MGQGRSSKTPPLVGLLLQVGSPWHVSVKCISLPILVLTSVSAGRKRGHTMECGIAMRDSPESCLVL